jgi:membrane associated rhomboid family serine protease
MKEIFSNTIKNFKTARLTYIILTYCLLVFFGIYFENKPAIIDDGILTKYGAPTAIEIYSDKQWGLISNSFVHFELGHLIINLLGTFLLATYVERRLGFWKLFIFGLIASFITSAYQLAFSNDAGIGLSGVNYTLFGFIYVKSFFDRKFKISNKHTIFIILISFIILCEIMTQLNHWNVATISLATGFLVGFIFALFKTKYRYFGFFLCFLVFSVALTSSFFNPWSATWNCAKGIHFHEKGNISKAKYHYMNAHKIDSESNCANDNLRLIRIDELSGKALELHMRGKYTEARRVYEEILRIDPANQWAKINMQRLP